MATNGNPNKESMTAAKLGHHRSPEHMSHEEHEAAKRAAKFGYGPLADMRIDDSARLPAFGGEFQPGLYRGVENRKFANPAPLGLCAFALTTFVLSLINLGARGLTAPNIVVALAFGYGGLVQLLAGMWYVNDAGIAWVSHYANCSLLPGRWLLATPSVRQRCPPMADSGFHSPSS